MSLRLPYVLAAIILSFLFGWFSRNPTSNNSSSNFSSIRDSVLLIRNRSDTIRQPAIRAPVVKGRALTNAQRFSLAIASISSAFAIDTVLCEDDQCDTISGVVIPEHQSILDLQIRHSPIVVVL